MVALGQAQTVLAVTTRGPGLHEITGPITGWVGEQGLWCGLLTVFCRHTSASLIIQENADSDVARDLETFFTTLVPEDPQRYRHTQEGPDDMPAHIKGALSDVSLTIPLVDGRLALGTWQGVFLFEHRHRPHRRTVVLHLLGQSAGI